MEKVLESVKTDADRRYFFPRLKNPHWIKLLQEHDIFKHPPSIKHLPDGYVQYPSWIELQYLKNVASEVPEEVIEILLNVSETDNPRFYEDVIDIALQIDASLSAKLKRKILEYACGKYPIIVFRFHELLHHWAGNGQSEAALELAEVLVEFQEDLKREEKQKLYKADPEHWEGRLDPQPRFGRWEYEQMLTKGIRSLAEQSPYRTAQILIEAVGKMISMRFHPDQLEKVGGNDYSTAWCTRVNHSSTDYKDSKETLIHALTFACEQVYERTPELVADLDEGLRSHHWEIFKRIRQHLYASHLNEQTMPWIQDQILTHEDYDKWVHHFEFQRMLRLACNHFGPDLLTPDERESIFKDILNGPSKRSFQERTGDQFTEELFEQRKRYFHRMQLNPFSPVLFGQYAGYFQELQEEQEKAVVDDDYFPLLSEGAKYVETRSPQPIEELKKMSDEELLQFLNDWDNSHYDPEKWWVEITFEGLAQAFQSVFKDTILHEGTRLCFWIKHLGQIQRPIYLRTMVSALREHVESKQFDMLDQCFDVCEWILSHPELPKEDGINRSDESREHPDWQSARRAVCDFVETCLSKEVDVPGSARDSLASLLNQLCTQYDRRLDQNERVFLNLDDPLNEAINNTRSRALESVIDFGYWVRRQSEDDKATVAEVFDILDRRLDLDAEYPLRLPEHVILVVRYGGIYGLDRDWVVRHKERLFPKEDQYKWNNIFGYFLQHYPPSRHIFDVFQSDMEHALEQIDSFNTNSDRRVDFIDALGRHIFAYYLWEIYPLTGDGSLIQRFYDGTEGSKEHWARLFDHVGRSLNNSGKQLTDEVRHRIIDFFEWRIESEEPLELKEFTFWLEAECLGAEWRLKSYLRVLDIGAPEFSNAYLELEALREMRGEHTALVLECFAKLVDLVAHNDQIYIPTEKAGEILRNGLDSDDVEIREKAEGIREKLIQCGHFELWERGEG